MSEPGELQVAKAELQKKKSILRRANERHDKLLESSSPDPQEVLEAKVGVAEAELGVAKAKFGVAEAELDEAKAKEDTPEQKIAELKENVAKAEREVAKAEREVAKADWELAKARNEDKGDIKLKKIAYEKALEEGQF
jgi:chromosome segregation ATPase